MAEEPDRTGRSALVGSLRWTRSVLLVGVLAFFALPFLTVGCVPAQFGTQSAGGSTTYSGYQMSFGLDPTRGRENLLPAQESLPDQIGLQPLALIALVLVVVGLVASFVVNDPRTRRLVGLATAALAAVVLVAAVMVARSTLVSLVTDQLDGQELEEGRVPGDFVGSGQGYVLTLLALLLVALGEGVALFLAARRTRRRAGEAHAVGPPGTALP